MMGNNTTVANTKDRLGAGKKATTKEGTQWAAWGHHFLGPQGHLRATAMLSVSIPVFASS
jgi:hypothetical protein